jgi:hypothetical protein
MEPDPQGATPQSAGPGPSGERAGETPRRPAPPRPCVEAARDGPNSFAILEITPQSLPPPPDGYVDLFGDDPDEARSMAGVDAARGPAAEPPPIAAPRTPTIPGMPAPRPPVAEALLVVGLALLGALLLAFGPRPPPAAREVPAAAATGPAPSAARRATEVKRKRPPARSRPSAVPIHPRAQPSPGANADDTAAGAPAGSTPADATLPAPSPEANADDTPAGAPAGPAPVDPAPSPEANGPEAAAGAPEGSAPENAAPPASPEAIGPDPASGSP